MIDVLLFLTLGLLFLLAEATAADDPWSILILVSALSVAFAALTYEALT